MFEFEYPGYFSRTTDASDSETSSWKLEGHDAQIAVYAYDKTKTHEDLVSTLREAMIAEFGRYSVNEETAQLILAKKKISGTTLDTFLGKEARMRQSFFDLMLTEGRFRYSLVLSDSPDSKGNPSLEAKGVLDLLEASFVLNPSIEFQR